MVAPVRLSGERPLADRVVGSLLRGAVATSRRFARGRGVGFACEVAGRLLARDGVVAFELAAGGRFLVERSDRYWLLPLLLDQSYEGGLDQFLTRSVAPGDWFFDCGANVGIWSVAVGSFLRDRSHVVAVEPSGAVFSQLRRNQLANDTCFSTVRRALSTRSGQEVDLFSAADDLASSTLVERLSPEHSSKDTVATISLEDLLGMRDGPHDSPHLTFVKLDIEGMERCVIGGFDPVAHDDVMLLYEDHGRDTESATSVVALEKGLRVFMMRDDGVLVEITHPDSLRSLKQDPARGYNLLAFSPEGRAADRFRRTWPVSALR